MDALAAATFALITLHLVAAFEGRDAIRLDPIRLVKAVTSGVALLAAEMIVFSGGKVKGLTTGAAMWCAASIGLGAGLGLWLVAGLTALLAFLISRILKRLLGTGGLEWGTGLGPAGARSPNEM